MLGEGWANAPPLPPEYVYGQGRTSIRAELTFSQIPPKLGKPIILVRCCHLLRVAAPALPQLC